VLNSKKINFGFPSSRTEIQKNGQFLALFSQ
jgi:hypothetical protein